MKIKALKCVNCSANLDIESGLTVFYCKYCGAKNFVELNSDAAYAALANIKAMEHEERMLDKKIKTHQDFYNREIKLQSIISEAEQSESRRKE